MSYSDYLAGLREGLHRGIDIGFDVGVRAGFQIGSTTGFLSGYKKGYKDSSLGLPYTPAKRLIEQNSYLPMHLQLLTENKLKFLDE